DGHACPRVPESDTFLCPQSHVQFLERRSSHSDRSRQSGPAPPQSSYEGVQPHPWRRLTSHRELPVIAPVATTGRRGQMERTSQTAIIAVEHTGGGYMLIYRQGVSQIMTSEKFTITGMHCQA